MALSRSIFALVCALSVLSNAYAERHGHISSSSCPYSCGTQGISKDKCRDWRKADICYVEDFSRPASPLPAMRPTPLLGGKILPAPGLSINRSGKAMKTPAHSSGWYSMGTQTALKSRDEDIRVCRSRQSSHIAKPYINVYDVERVGPFLSGKYRVRGSIEGICIVDAGFFEDGRKIQSLRFRTTPEFGRYEFQFSVRQNHEPEIRVYNSNGSRDVFRISPGAEYDPASRWGSSDFP